MLRFSFLGLAPWRRRCRGQNGQVRALWRTSRRTFGRMRDQCGCGGFGEQWSDVGKGLSRLRQKLGGFSADFVPMLGEVGSDSAEFRAIRTQPVATCWPKFARIGPYSGRVRPNSPRYKPTVTLLRPSSGPFPPVLPGVGQNCVEDAAKVRLGGRVVF